MAKRLAGYEALVFDCYGTLIDWETGIRAAARPLLAANGERGAAVADADILRAFAEAEGAAQRAAPDLRYPEILERTHRGIAGALGLETTEALDRGFGASVPDWPAFPDSAEALAALAERYRLVVLSNVDRESFGASNDRLGVAFDAIYTAQDIGSYKPDPRNFRYAIDRVGADFGIAAEGILHTAQSMHHDLAQAAAHGLATAWIDRQRLSEGGDWGATAPVENAPEPDFVFFTLGEMAEAVRREG